MATMKKAKTGTSVPKTNSVSKNIGNLNKAKNGKPVKKAFLGKILGGAGKALGGLMGGGGKEGGGGIGGMLGGLLGGKNGKTVKKSKNGSSLGMKSVKSGYDNNAGVTRADFVSIGKGTAKSGTKMKMGGKIKKAQTGTVEPSAARIQSTNQKIQSNVNKSAMRNAGDSMQKSAAGAAKNGKSMKKCKYGCK